MTAMESKASVVPEDNCDDAPPSYSSEAVPSGSSTQATAVSVIKGVEVQRQEVRSSSSNYSCGNSKVEVAERITRIIFIVIMITFAGLTIASMARISYKQRNNVYYSDDYFETTKYEEASFNPITFLLFFLLSISLCCTTLSVITDIFAIIAQFLSSKIINHTAFRALDIIKWIVLITGLIFVFLLIKLFTRNERYDNGSVLITYLVFSAITMVMGVIMSIWDCTHLLVSVGSTSPSSQVVTIVPVNSTPV